MKPKKIVFLNLTLVMIFNNSLSFAQNSALDAIIKERSDAVYESEQNSESLKRLNNEKRILIDKLVDVNKQHEEILKTQTQKTEILPVAISLNEIESYIARKTMGRCKIKAGEYSGEYIIQKDKIKIRFAFLPADSVNAPKLSVVKGENNEDVFQIEQTGYDPQATHHKGDMHAILRFEIKGDNTPGEFTHAVFMGQRLEDRWFGRSSSLDYTTLTCVLGRG